MNRIQWGGFRLGVMVVFLSGISVWAQTTGTGTVTTSIPTARSFQPWAITLSSEAFNRLETVRLEGGANTETKFRLAYRFNNQMQGGVLVGANYKIVGEGVDQATQDMVASDVALAGLYVVPEVLGADRMQVDGRLYLPSSEASQKRAQIYQLRADILLPYTIAPQRSVVIFLSPRYTDFEVAGSNLDIISQIKLAQGRTVAPYLAINHAVKMNDGESGFSRTEETMGPEVGVDLNPHPMVRLSLLVGQAHHIINPTQKNARENFAVFDEKETRFLMGAQLRL